MDPAFDLNAAGLGDTITDLDRSCCFGRTDLAMVANPGCIQPASSTDCCCPRWIMRSNSPRISSEANSGVFLLAFSIWAWTSHINYVYLLSSARMPLERRFCIKASSFASSCNFLALWANFWKQRRNMVIRRDMETSPLCLWLLHSQVLANIFGMILSRPHCRTNTSDCRNESWANILNKSLSLSPFGVKAEDAEDLCVGPRPFLGIPLDAVPRGLLPGILRQIRI